MIYIVCVGNLKEKYLLDACNEYVKRINRYEKIEVEYLDINFKKHKQVFTGFTAQIIQHEVDHFEGIII